MLKVTTKIDRNAGINAIEADIKRLVMSTGNAQLTNSKAVLEGRTGSIFSHQYYHEELGKLVNRYLIKHDQTGRLKNSGKKRVVNRFHVRTWFSAPYAGDVADLDRKEVNISYGAKGLLMAVNGVKKIRNVSDNYENLMMLFA